MASLLIINADDLGYDPAVSAGILRAMREGLVSSATLMVNTPFSEEAAATAVSGRDRLALGLHFNLARFPPVWAAFPREWMEGSELSEARADRLPAEVVSGELTAQLERFERLTGRVATHLDAHKHLHRHAGVLEGVAAVARARGLPVRAIDSGMRAALRAAGVRITDHFIGDAGAEAYWTLERFISAVGALADGATELMCHPGHAPSAVRSGYAEQREVELATFLHPEARRALEASGAVLGSFAAL